LKTLLLFMAQTFMAPDGAGGGGLIRGLSLEAVAGVIEEGIQQLNKAKKEDRKAIVEDIAKALELKTGDVYKKLKEAGWDPKGDGGKDQTPPAETFPVKLRHKTPHPHYRRAGLVLTGQFKPYEVTGDQLEILKKDTWVEIEK
jgi:hypothetical protein